MVAAVPLNGVRLIKGLRKGLPKDNPDVLRRMVVVYLEISFGTDSQIHLAVKCQKGQHVVKETDSRRDIPTSSTIQIQYDLDPSLSCLPVYLGIPNAGRLLTHAASYTIGESLGRARSLSFVKYACPVSIQSNLAGVRERIEAACAIAGRDPSMVTLIAVSKLRSVDQIRAAYDSGQRDFGENRLQEAQPKIEVLPNDIVWHFIGPLQSNKAKKIATLFNVLHTFCKQSQLVEAEKAQRYVDALVEVNIANEQQKSGISVKQLDEMHGEVIKCEHVHFRGLMTVGPVVSNAEEMRPYFREMQTQRARLGADWLSMGMSGDFEVAIQEGASHIRVGTAIFGSRQ